MNVMIPLARRWASIPPDKFLVMAYHSHHYNRWVQNHGPNAKLRFVKSVGQAVKHDPKEWGVIIAVDKSDLIDEFKALYNVLIKMVETPSAAGLWKCEFGKFV